MGVHCRRSGSKRKRPSISRDKRARTAALSNWRRAFFLLYKVVDSPAPDQDRKPVSVEEDNCGWDVTSLDDGQVARYIEVKGRAGRGGVALTPNEWIKSQRFGKDYWLYVVVNCKSNPQLHLIQDPASKLSPKEEVSVVRYMVGLGNWKQAACVAGEQ